MKLQAKLYKGVRNVCKICCSVRPAASRVRLFGLISPTALKHPCRSRKIKNNGRS